MIGYASETPIKTYNNVASMGATKITMINRPTTYYIHNEMIRTTAGVANVSETNREARLRWLEYVERKTVENIVSYEDMEVSGQRNIGRPNLSWKDVIQ